MKKIWIFAVMISISVLIVKSYNSFAKTPELLTEEIKAKIPFDAIIVPGVPYADESWNRVLMGRIYWAHYLYKNGYTQNIIFSGSAVYTPYIESEIMAMYAQKLGVPKENIFVETKAEHSVENVYYSHQIAKEKGFEKVALATDPFQSRMLKGPSKRMNIDISFVFFSTDVFDTLQIQDIQIEAHKAYQENFVSLTERETFWQRLRGTFGKNLPDFD